METSFLSRLHAFFSDVPVHQLAQKVVFAPGTGPMRKENSEVEDILFATDFDDAYFVDPVYSVRGEDSPLAWDVASIKRLDSASAVMHVGDMVQVIFNCNGKQRRVLFVAGDATRAQYQPKDFTIFFSGKRIGVYPGVGLRGTPSEYLHEIVRKLPVGGYLVPDRVLLDDSVYFVIPPSELGLEEVMGIRQPISKKDFSKEYSEDTRFIHTDFAPGVGLYKKIREV